MVRRALTAAMLVALAGALTACGVRNTIDPVADAATKTQKAGGVDVTLSSTFSTGGREVTVQGHGSFDGNQGEMELDLGKLLPQAGLLGGANMTFKEIFLTENGDHVFYVQFPLFSSLLGGKSWMRVDLEQAGRSAGVDVSKLLKGSGLNPADMLALLKSSGDFSEVGSETIDGVSTTHYHGTVDLEQALKDKGLPSDLEQRIADLGVPTQVPYDVWVDDQGLVRQIEQRYDQATGGLTTSYSSTVRMSDYGTAVSVAAPPPDQVFDASSFAPKS